MIESPARSPLDVIVLAGVTGTGKTALSLALAKHFEQHGRQLEIINADALQLYRGMDIGTAKIGASERTLVPHHLFDVLEVTETATVADFQQRARTLIRDIQARGATPVLVGGSGLYLSAVLHDFNFPPQDATLRAELEQRAETLAGQAELLNELKTLDPEAWQKIEHRNIRRAIRALEVVLLTAQPFSASLPEHAKSWIPATWFFLDGDRENIRQRLRTRVELMFTQGLIAETEQLLSRGLESGTTAVKAIGYAQAIQVIRGELSEEEAITEAWLLATRYARRQRSWFNRYQNIHRLDYADPELLTTVLNILEEAETQQESRPETRPESLGH